MLRLGETQELRLVRKKDFGAYLSDSEGEEVLLPEKEVPEGAAPGDMLRVFVYKDSTDRPIATSHLPLMEVGEVARVRVSDMTGIGAFVDIGLPKQVLIPHREMRYEPKVGDEVEVYLYVDRSARLAASMYTRRHLEAKHLNSKDRKRYFYEQDAEKLLRLLDEKFQGHVPYTDKTVQPERVMQDFGMSKAAFKRALGKLLKEGKVKMTKTAIFYVY